MTEKQLSGLSEEVPAAVKKYADENAVGLRSFVSFLEIKYGCLVQRAFAFRRHSKKSLEIREFARRVLMPGCRLSIVRDLCFSYMAGYVVVFPGDYCAPYSGKKAYDWCESYEKCNIPYGPTLNIEVLTSVEQYKYCGYQNSVGDLQKYLAWYNKDPRVELFGKCGLMPTTMLVRMLEKDKKFAKFLYRYRESLLHLGVKRFIWAYDTGRPADNWRTVQRAYNQPREVAKHMDEYRKERAMQDARIDFERLEKYLLKQSADVYELYWDYHNACIELGKDLRDTKNVYPLDLKRAHDERCDELRVINAEREEKELAEHEESFTKLVARLLNFEYKSGDYCMIVPKHLIDIYNEGDQLDHCVYRMGYHLKMLDGGNLILFVRNAKEADKPFVTVEFDFETNTVKQAYGYQNHVPDGDVLDFVEKWREHVIREHIQVA